WQAFLDLPLRARLTYEAKPTAYQEYASSHGKVLAYLLLAEHFPQDSFHFLDAAEKILREHPLHPKVEYGLLRGEETALMALVAERWALLGENSRAERLWETAVGCLSRAVEQVKALPQPKGIPEHATLLNPAVADRYDIRGLTEKNRAYYLPKPVFLP